MHAFAANIDIRSRLVIKPEVRFQPAFVGHLGVAHRPALARRINDVFVAKVSFLHRLSQIFEDPIRNGDFADFRTNCLENASFQNDFWVRRQNLSSFFLGPLDVCEEVIFCAPQAEGTGNVFSSTIRNHADVVPQRATSVQQAFDADRA